MTNALTLKQKLNALKGRGIMYQGVYLVVRTWYMLDGDVNIITDGLTIRMRRTYAEEQVGQILDQNTIHLN